MTEVAEAAAEGLQAENLIEIEQAIASDTPLSEEKVRLRSGEVANQGFTYLVSPSDAAQWIAAWRMEVGRDGKEYGRPTKLNKQQLGLHLSRRRPDGGRLFVIKMPQRVVPPGRFQCFAVPEQCQKKLSSKGMLLDHIENFHPTAARHFHEELEIIRKSLNRDNAALRPRSSNWRIHPTTRGWRYRKKHNRQAPRPWPTSTSRRARKSLMHCR